MKNRLRVFQILALVFGILTLWFGYKWAQASRRDVCASFIVFHCTVMQDQFIDADGWNDQGHRMDAIQNYLGFLVGYYEAYTSTLAGSYAEWIVKREYSTTISNTLTVLRDGLKVDYGPDPHRWIDAYNKKAIPSDANNPAQATGKPSLGR